MSDDTRTDEEKTAEVEAAQRLEAERTASGRVRVQRPKPPAVGPGNEPAAPMSPSQVTEAGEEMVHMVFPKEVVLTLNDHRRVRFPIGLVAVPAHLADHWYLKANGVERAELQH